MSSETILLLAAAALVAVLLLAWGVARRRRRGATGDTSAAPPSPSDRLRRGLTATRDRLRAQLDAALGQGPRPFDVVMNDLEEALIGADVGVKTTGVLLERVREQVRGTVDAGAIRDALEAAVEDMVPADEPPSITGKPWVILVTGVNGVGKTTTIGKLAALHVAQGRKVLLVAADTFRAAAIEQLAVWAERAGVEIVRHKQGADPSAVVFDGMKAAMARGADLVLVDTAGRLHTRSNLMDELRKVRRVIGTEVPGAPHETLLVLDATTGQNAISQARSFQEAVEVTGVVLTKLDGTARGGVVVPLRHELGLPVRYVGVGEGIEDLRPFDARVFTSTLFASEPAGRRRSAAAAEVSP
ncbi:MAG TPA: signal recognition particle-docking protein FtsY [Candidatus Binatia bacterium]|jgi:fused signal recognition particle receptor|nr:signal recognition particle-docking protein FtsY [Candidatus Binatia bacterium]